MVVAELWWLYLIIYWAVGGPVTTRVMLLLVYLKLSYRSTYRAFSVNIAFFLFEEKLLILAKLDEAVEFSFRYVWI